MISKTNDTTPSFIVPKFQRVYSLTILEARGIAVMREIYLFFSSSTDGLVGNVYEVSMTIESGCFGDTVHIDQSRPSL